MTIPIFYSISDNFTPYAAVSLYSLTTHTNPQTNYVVYFLNQDLSRQHQLDLLNLRTNNVQVKFFHIDAQLVKPIQNRQENFLRADFFTMSIFYRLFIPDLFPQYEKAIYLDSDTIVNDDLAKLFQIKLGNNLFAACTDASIQQVPAMLKYIREVLTLNPRQYINSGMLVMNSKAFRDRHFIARFFDLLTKYHFNCIAPDQDYLNEIGAGSILHLDPRWDAMPNEHTPEIQDPGLIHYNLFFKPWHFKQIQYEKYFWQNAKQTKFYKQLKQELNNYTDQQRQLDRHKLIHMLNKENTAFHDPLNWAHVKQLRKVNL